eukprot:scaffold83002_cov63-Phaeocystis_antarctica.AAC.2
MRTTHRVPHTPSHAPPHAPPHAPSHVPPHCRRRLSRMGHEAEAAALERAAAEQRAALQRVLAGSAADPAALVQAQLSRGVVQEQQCGCLQNKS